MGQASPRWKNTPPLPPPNWATWPLKVTRARISEAPRGSSTVVRGAKGRALNTGAGGRGQTSAWDACSHVRDNTPYKRYRKKDVTEQLTVANPTTVRNKISRRFLKLNFGCVDHVLETRKENINQNHLQPKIFSQTLSIGNVYGLW